MRHENRESPPSPTQNGGQKTDGTTTVAQLSINGVSTTKGKAVYIRLADWVL